MIKKFLILLTSLLSAQAFSLEPGLKVNIGYPLLSIQNNEQAYTDDFLAVGFGAQMQFSFNRKNKLSFIIDSSYTPRRVNFSFTRRGREIDGKTSLLTSFYSMSYYYLFNSHKGTNYYLSLGPTIGIYTLNYLFIDNNDTSITKVNRVRVRTKGLRLSFKMENIKTKNFFEIVGLYTEQDKLTVIDDATNDAQMISSNESRVKRKTKGVLFNYGFHLF